ncbi:dihydroorotase [Paenibacillus konkukensis]|uniref:Dihydroorotase n=1 Tax=Paenibacillus konkukensis TaxID=2020716 RepID=A0ABY4RJK1_9BACL|nr:amidohydrolase/deacetylase family metallohydrolase [Paenibacillus konkukensis]UQZ82644.1 dihydroorotase [Paenibacillus konkukensis]
MDRNILLRRVRLVGGEEVDVAINAGIITDIVPGGTALCRADSGTEIWERPGTYVSSGWIDLHVHAFPEFDPYGDEIDEIGVKQGVTTIVDAGSCGADRIGDLAAGGRKADTRLLAFLNISRIGLKRIDELSRLEWIDRDKLLQAVSEHPELIVGLKARISRSVVGESGIQPLRIARELSERTGLPLMVHIGSAPPDIREVMPLLCGGDVVTHYLNGKSNNLFDEEGKPLDVLREAVRRGVHLDVGHGTASFSFRVAEAAKRHGIDPNTISTDIYRGNRLNGPVYSMSNLLSKFLCLGYTLEQTVDWVTVRAAEWLKRPELGRIRVGDRANLTLFGLEERSIELIDSEGETRTAARRIEAKGAIIGDKLIKC